MSKLVAILREAATLIGIAAHRNPESVVYIGCRPNSYIDQMEV